MADHDMTDIELDLELEQGQDGDNNPNPGQENPNPNPGPGNPPEREEMPPLEEVPPEQTYGDEPIAAWAQQAHLFPGAALDDRGNVKAVWPHLPPLPIWDEETHGHLYAEPSKRRNTWNWFSTAEKHPQAKPTPEKGTADNDGDRHGMKVDYPDKWKGDTVWKLWYDCFLSAVAAERKPSSDIQQARKLYSLLAGDPLVWIHAKFSAKFQNNSITLRELVTELEGAPFKRAEEVPMLRRRLANMTMVGTNRDSYEKHAMAFVQILGKIPPQDEAATCFQFLEKLHPTLKADLLREAPQAPGYSHREWTNFTALQTRATELWNIHCTTRESGAAPANEEKGSKKRDKGQSDSGKQPKHQKKGKDKKKPTEGSEQAQLNRVLPDKDISGNPITKESNQQAREANKCAFCGRDGHRWPACRNLHSKYSDIAAFCTGKKQKTNTGSALLRRTSGQAPRPQEQGQGQEIDPMLVQDLDFNDLSASVKYMKDNGQVPERAHAWNLKLKDDMFDYICKLSGMNPTVDANPCPDRHVVRSTGSEVPFLERTLPQNACVWMCPPTHSETINKYVDHYLAQKALDPTLSAILILPDSLSQSTILSLKEKMELVYTLAPHASVWERLKLPSGALEATPTTRRRLVLVDRGATRSLDERTAALRDNVFFSLPATVAGTDSRITVLNTTGSLDTCFSGEALININLVRHMGLAIHDASHRAEWGDGTPLKAYGETSFKLTIDKFSCRVKALVVDLAESFDLLLGDTWMRRYGTVLDYKAQTVTFRKSKKSYTIRLPSYKKSRKPAVVRPIAAAKLHKHLRTAVQVFVCFVKEVPEAKAPPGQHPDITQLMLDLADVFIKELPADLGKAKFEKEVIPTPDGHKAPYQPMYRYSPAEKEEIKRQIVELLSANRIRPSTSPYGAPLLFVQKADGTLRMCINYRKLNKITIKNKYPIPRIDDLLDALGESKVFSTLDLKQGYHQIQLTESDIPKTAFNTPFGHYEYVVLPFGLTNAPSAFQNYMNDVLRPYIGISCLVYLDDIIVFSKTHEDHIKHLREVLITLRDNDLFVHPDKCVFLADRIAYLGHIITPEGLKADPKKTAVVQEWPTPTEVLHVQQFLGLCNYFRRFVDQYSKQALPLTRLTRDNYPWRWGTQEQEAFETLKQALVSPPVLRMPDFTKPFTVETDASDYALGGILSQEGRPVAYESRTLTPAEQNYGTPDKECLAVIHCYTTWRCYLEGVESTCITDHHPLTFLLDQPKLNRRQARWLEFLASFRPHIVYRPGERNPADPLSRLRAGLSRQRPLTRTARVRGSVISVARASPPPASSRVCLVAAGEDVQVYIPSPLSKEVIIQGYAQDPWFTSEDFQKLLHRTIRKDQDLYFQGDRLVIPAGLTDTVIADCHDPPFVGHMGISKTLEQVGRRYWWRNWRKDVTQYVRACHHCQVNKPLSGKPYGPLMPLSIPATPWESVSIDFVTSLPLSDKGCDTLVVFMDRLTKMVHLVPTTKHYSAESCAELFVDHVFRYHGLPKEFVTDRDKVWTSDYSRTLYKGLGIQQCMTTAYHPESDGQVERMNRVVQQVLRHYVEPCAKNWDRLLSLAEFAINSAKQESTGHTPFQLNYGFTPPHPLDRRLEEVAPRIAHWLPKHSTPEEYKAQMALLLDRARKLLKQAQDQQKAYADSKRSAVPEGIREGKDVLLSTRNLRLHWRGTTKFMPRYIGPFTITEQVNPAAYRLKLPEEMKIHDVFHVSLLKPYYHSGRYQPPPPAVFVENLPEYQIQSVIDHRSTPGYEIQYLISWKGHGPERNTWENESDLTCDDTYENSALIQYWLNTPRNFPENLAKPTTKTPSRVTRKRRR